MRRALFASSLLFGATGLAFACSSNGGSPAADGGSSVPPPSGSPDASVAFGEDAAPEASVLLESCNPSGPATCPTGFTCYAAHTSPAWWVDLYGKCTFGCTSESLPRCVSLDGVCGCPVTAVGTSACGIPDGAVLPVDAASLVDAGAASGDGGTVAPDEDSGPSLPQPITATSLVCVPAVKPGAAAGG